MEPELPLGTSWPHTALLQCMQHLMQAATLLMQELDPDDTLESLSREAAAALRLLQPTLGRRLRRPDSTSDWSDWWDDQQWLQNFRMRKETFLELCAWLAPALQRRDSPRRPAIPLEKKVAIALRKLATPDSYRVVGDQFGVRQSSVGVILMQVVKAINSILLYKVIQLGDQDATVAGFAALGFPNCGGAIDGTHIPIRAPDFLGPRFLNRKGYFSMVLQALVDHRGQFTDVYAGWSGKADDAHIFRHSGLYKKLKKGTYFSHREFAVGDVQMPLCIVGDEAYPLMPWLMKPYTGHLDPSREQFNTHLNRARNQAERAFSRLKARFRCLLTRLNVGEKNMAELIAACCILHNIVEKKGEAFLPSWEADASQVGRAFEQPQTVAIRQAHQAGVRIREALREKFSQAPQ